MYSIKNVITKRPNVVSLCHYWLQEVSNTMCCYSYNVKDISKAVLRSES
jgi:hypothetical protein